MTEAQKKEYYRKRVERDLAGNPNAPNYKKPKAIKFPPPSEEEKERMKYLDSYGNPLPGYKWEGNKIVEDGTAVQMMKTKGIRVRKVKYFKK